MSHAKLLTYRGGFHIVFNQSRTSRNIIEVFPQCLHNYIQDCKAMLSYSLAF